ncbi:Brp/Blh family beta-carotene 15,15'-dioxygenase [Hyphobacterium sp. CCMP332]|nr:Brp/Blh family beta-carotene 15,15'-dioxygenase [Hyphobacterium sp. CCMP332]
MRFLYKIIVLFLGIIIYRIFPEFDLYLAFALIFIFGIPHGATDHILHNLIDENKMNPKPKPTFLMYYLGIILSYAVLWYFFPGFSLFVFIVISAFHFGETQLHRLESNNWIKILNYIFWGSSLLLLIFEPHLSEVQTIISPHLLDVGSMNWVISNYYYLLYGFLIGSFVFLISEGIKTLLVQLTELIILYLIANFTSLILAFALFFAFWHSRDATYDQITKIRKYAINFNFKEWLKLASPYSLISILGIVLIIVFSLYIDLKIPTITLFFVLVALITLPHVFVMSVFYRKTK